MGKILQIAVNLVSLVVILGLIGWVLIRSLKRSTDPAKLIFKWVFTLVMLWVLFRYAVPMFVGGGPEAFVGLILGCVWGVAMTITWRHSITDLIADPIASLYDGGSEPPEPKPFYSIALTKRKMNKPLEAIVAVREQLAKFPNDYEGTMLLAAIQAEDTKDLPSAELTLRHFCHWEKAPAKQIAAALTQLADWHLKIAKDTDAAHTFLEEIAVRFPASELLLQARERIAHLGGTRIVLTAAQDRQAVAVPEGARSAGLRDSMKDLVPSEASPEELAAFYVKHLEQHPQDTEAREKLAVIYARHYGRLDLATLELQQLINEPNHPPKRVAHWLNLLADLQIHGNADYDTVRTTLEKIVETFPDLPVAEVAKIRLSHLKLEIKGQKETPGKKLGVYEQNIGLKYGPTYGSLGRQS